MEQIKNFIREYISNMEIFPPIDNPLAEDLDLSDKQLLSEAYYKTYPVDNVIKYVKEIYGNNILEIIPHNIGNSTRIQIKTPIDIDYTDINKAMSLCGYYQSSKGNGYETFTTRTITYEPRYSDNFSDMLKNQRHLYHASPLRFKDKILKNGLCPHSKNNRFDFPDRVYLFKEYDDESGETINPAKLIGYAKQLRMATLSIDSWAKDYNGINNDVWVFYSIDTNKLSRTMKFYDDVSWARNPFAIWTYDNIPPNALTIIGKHNYGNEKNNI